MSKDNEDIAYALVKAAIDRDKTSEELYAANLALTTALVTALFDIRDAVLTTALAAERNKRS